MTELNEDIITQGDPIPKPKLSDPNKAKLDSVVLRMIANKEPEHNIQAVVDDFKSKYSQAEAPQQQAFKIDLSQPTFKAAAPMQTPQRTFTDQAPVDEYGLAKLQNKATAAKSKIDLELHSNDAQYEKKLREYRRDNFTIDDLKNESKEKGYIIPVGKEKEALALAKQRQYNLPVAPEDISDIKTGTILNQSVSRQFIRELDNPEAHESAYRIDAYNHAASDPDGNARAPKIEENAKKIKKGEYVYDPVNMVLGKKEGFIGSVFTGRKELNNSFDLYHYIKDKPDASVLQRLNTELATDIDEPVPIPANKLGEIGKMMGGQPVKGMIAGGVAAAAATFSGHPDMASGAFNLVNAGVSAVDMYKIGFANAVKANYAAFKRQGLSDQEALDKAKPLAEDQANVDAAAAALMSFGAGKMAFKPSGFTLATMKKSLGTALMQIGEAGVKKTLEGVGIGTIGGVGQIIKNMQAQSAGLPTETTEGFKEQVEAGVLLTAATHVIAKTATSLKPSALNKLADSFRNVPDEVVANSLSQQEQQGHITPEEARRAQDIIQKAKTIDALIPTDIPETDRLKIGAKIRERNLLKEKIDKVDEAYHPEIKEQIKGLNEEIISLSKGSERGDLQKLVTKEINADNVHGAATDVLRHATEKELEAHMKDIAEQANDPATADATVEAFGENIVNKAKELYPPKIQDNASTIRSDEGEISDGGVNPEVGQEQSGGDIQQPEGAATITAETEQQTGGGSGGEPQGNAEGKEGVNPMEGGIPPNMHDLPFTPEGGDVTRLAHADTEHLYRDLGMTDRIPRATKSDIALESEADNLIKNGYDFEGKADRVLSGRDKSFTDTEQVAFAKMVGALNVKLQGLEVNTPEFNDTLDIIERLSRASDKVGSEEGAALRARRMFMLNDETLSSFMQTAKEANLDVPLTPEQAAAVKGRFDDLQASKDAYRARVEKLAAENAKLRAEKGIKEISSKINKEQYKDTETEIKKVLNDIKNKLSQSNDEDILYAEGEAGPISEKMFKSGDAVSDVLNKIKESNLGAYSRIAKELLEISDIDSLNVKIREYKGDDRYAYYSRDNDHIYFNEEKSISNKTVMHEIIHAMTSKKIPHEITTYRTGSGHDYFKSITDKENVFYKNKNARKIVNLYIESVRKLGQEDFLFGRDGIANKYSDFKKSNYVNKIYGLLNVDEFLAEAFTNGKFQKTLMSIKSDGITIWDKFVNYIKEVLGIKSDVLSEVLELGKKIIASDRPNYGDRKGIVEAMGGSHTDKLKLIVPEVNKMIEILAAKGEDSLTSIISKIHERLKEAIPGITEKNVHDIIAGEYNKKQTKNELQEKIYDIHLQAKLVNRLEALQAGVQPKGQRQRLIRNAEIENLRKQIKELQGRPEKTDAQKLAALKARYKSQMEELQKKIDTGDFKPDEIKEIELDKEAQGLKDAYIKKKREWQKAIAQDAYNNRTLGQKTQDRAIEILNIPRTLMASADLSAPLRQGLVVTASHPLVASKAFIESIRQALFPERFDRWLYDLKESDYYKNVLEKSGLYIADPNNLHLAAKEEAFMTNLAEKIPVLGKIVEKSEKAYVSFLNKMRVDVFTMYAKDLADRGITPGTRPDIYEGLATFVNAATGRGELGKLEPAAKILNTAFFSPRLMASRINMLNPVWYASLPKEVRIMALKDMGKMIAAGTITLTLLSMVPGVSVELNPTSTDFGKVKMGNTRWDIWGGFQQYVRVFSQIIFGHEKKADGSIVPLGPKIGQESRGEKVLKLFRGKLAPIPSIVTDLAMGKTAVGDDVELSSELKEHLIPMIYNDVKDAWQEQGPMSLLYTGVPSFLGVGTTTYEPKASASSSKKGKHTKGPKHTKNTKK